MKLAYANGITSVILRVRIGDTASSTGGGKTGLTFASAGLVISTIADNEPTATVYTQAASNIETITTLGTFAPPTAGKCRFKEVDATNHPGLYEIQIANARWAVSNARSIVVSVSGASGAAQNDSEIQLDPVPADVRKLLGTAWLTPATPGTPDVNAKQWNGLATVALPLVPTTPGRTIDLTAGGEVDLSPQVIAQIDAIEDQVTTSLPPGVAPGSVGGLPVVDANGRVKSKVEVIDNDAITGNSIAASGIAKFWDALTSGITTVGSIGLSLKTMLASWAAMVTGNKYTAAALENAPTGSGGGGPSIPPDADVDWRFEPIGGMDLAAASIQYLKVRADAYIGGRETDPNFYPVEFAFRVDGVADELVWHEAVWNAAGQARVLVGPDQDVEFTAGPENTLYEWWVRVVAAPETTMVRLPQYLRVY